MSLQQGNMSVGEFAIRFEALLKSPNFIKSNQMKNGSVGCLRMG